MTLNDFAAQLGDLIDRALEASLPVSELCNDLAIAGMILDERRPEMSYPDEMYGEEQP